MAQDNDQWQRAKYTRMVFRAPKADYVVIFSAQSRLDIISLIIDRGHTQYIEFTAGYYHLVLTPRWKYYRHLDITCILPESIRQDAIFSDNGSPIMFVIN